MRPAAAALITRPGRATRRPPRRLGAVRAAVTLAAVAVATDHHLTTATGAVEQAGGRGHRQLLPMSPGSSPTSGRYLPTARATHAPGCGTGEDCGGRDQCRTCLNGTDPVDHGAALVIPLGGGARRAAHRRLGAGFGPGCATLRRGRTRRQTAQCLPTASEVLRSLPLPLRHPATR